jgi:hypothetical protein
MAVLDSPANKYAEVTPEQAKAYLRLHEWQSDPALSLVCLDAEKAENFTMSKAFFREWDDASLIYQSPQSSQTWAGSQTAAASVNLHIVSDAVNAIVPQIVGGMFADNPPFMVVEQGDTTDQTAKAISAVLAWQLEDIDFREQIELGTTNTTLYGTQVYKWGWERFTKTRKIYRRKNKPVVVPASIPGAPPISIENDEFEEDLVDEITDRPTFEHVVNLKHVLVDPTLNVPDIRKAKYVIHRMYMTYDDLDKLRDREGFNIPSKSELLSLFLPPLEPTETDPASEAGQLPIWDQRAAPQYTDVTADPFEKPLEVLERWDNDTYIVVLNKKLVLCSVENPYGKIPFLSCNWQNVPGGFWGMGLAQTIGVEQRLQQGLINADLNMVALMLNTPLVRVKGQSVPTQNIRIGPGRIIEVDKAGDLTPLGRYAPVPEAFQHIQLSQARAEQSSGSNSISSSGSAGNSGHSNISRSATGANLLAAGSTNLISSFIDRLANQVITPFLYEMFEMDKAMLPPSQLRYILNEELRDAYLQEGNDLVDILNAKLKFTIAAGSKLNEKRNMAQAWPSMIQFLNSPETTQQLAVSGLKVDIQEVVETTFYISGFKNEKDIIVPMTPEDVQRQQALQQGAQTGKIQAQAQTQAALQQQKFEQQQQLQDEGNIARAARDVLREQYKAQVEGKPVPGTVDSF